MTKQKELAGTGMYNNQDTYKFLFFIMLILLFFNNPSIVYAQNSNFKFEHITITEGLSQNSVTSILQDRKGFMWFGTMHGLNRYDGINNKIYTQKVFDQESLSDSWITSLLEDSRGSLWVGTYDGGLNKYDRDKDRFINYLPEPDNPNSLSHNRVLSICEDKFGSIWIGTEGGELNKLIYSDSSAIFTSFRHEPDNPNSISNSVILSLFGDKKGNIWIGTGGGGLTKAEPDPQKNSAYIFTTFKNDKNNRESLSNNRINSILEDRYGFLWIGTDEGLNRLDAATGKFNHFDNLSLNLNEIKIQSIIEDRAGNLWIGTENEGIIKFETDEKGIIQNYSSFKNNPDNKNCLNDNSVYSIYEDRSGIIWIGTMFGGLTKCIQGKNVFRTYQTAPEKYSKPVDKSIWEIYQDRNDVIWIGTNNGGLVKFDRNKNKYNYYLHDPENPDGLGDNKVNAVFEEEEGIFWIGTNGGLNRLDSRNETFSIYKNDPANPKSLSFNYVTCLFEDRAGEFWVGTFGGGLNLFDRENESFTSFNNNPDDPGSLNYNIINCILEDRTGKLWVGTHGSGLNLFDREAKKFKVYKYEPDNHQSLSNNRIGSIYEDKAGNLWIGTFGGGLNRFDSENEVFFHYTVNDGLSDNMVYDILEDDKGTLWISTNNGISNFDPEKKIFRNYSFEDGLQSNEFNSGTGYKNDKGEMFFGGINGFNSFFPDSMKINSFIPEVVITDFLLIHKPVTIGEMENGREILSKSVTETEEIVLSYEDNYLSFRFAALDYINPLKNEYAYKVDNFNKEWINIGNKHEIDLNLPPGDYVFRVRGSNNDGLWNLIGTSIKIKITPPFWARAWFRIICFAVIIFVVFSGHKIRMQGIKKRNIQLEQYNKILNDQIKEREKAEKALRENEKKYRDLTETLPQAIFEFDLNANLTFVNRHSFKLFGYSENDYKEGLNTLTMLVPEDRTRAMENIQRRIKGENLKEVTYTAMKKDGTRFPIIFYAIPIMEENKPVGFRGFIVDITERVKAEKAIRESEEHYRDLVDKAGVAISIEDQDGKIVYFNKNNARLHGYKENEMMNLTFEDLVHPGDYEKVLNNHKARIAGKYIPKYEFRGLKKDRSIIHLEVDSTVLKENDKVVGTRTYMWDVTDRNKAEEEKKKLEEQLFQSQKMESIGRLAGGVAHDFNNILVSIMGYAELLKHKFNNASSFEGEAADIIFQGAKRAGNLTKQLLGFARGGKYNIVPLKINDVIEDTVKVSEKMFEKNITVQYDFEMDINTIEADKNQLNQILTNLIINAKDAMPTGGVLFFKTENIYIDDKYVKQFPYFNSGDYVKISVTDSGIGMTQKVKENIFEPFFTTKGEGKGTGLGLATVYGIVKNHGGHINVYSEPGEGTTFTLFFPVSEKDIKKIEKKDGLIKGDATILVVDDEKDVRKLAKKMLSGLGYNVIVAENGKEALIIYKAEKENIDLVLLDMIMPELAGRETNLELRKINPDIKVLLSSGYSRNGMAGEILEEGVSGFIQKPFTLVELSKKISEILNIKR